MSNLLYMDKSNGNGVYAVRPNSSNGQMDNDNGLIAAGAPATTSTTSAAAAGTGANATMMATTNNISIMNGAAAAAAASASGLPTSASSEDLSQSLSEYTDADESISAPTEFLAEFLSAVMLKDYKKALKYCKLILQYEPNNATAKEFYPLILDKLRAVATSSDSDENYNKSSSPELALDLHASDVEADVDVDECGDGEADVDADADADADADDVDGSESSNNCSEEEDNGWGDDEIDNVDVMDGEEESSSSGDDFELPIDDAGQDPVALASHNHHAHIHSHSHSHSHNDSGSSRNSSSGGGGRSDNTTHSYSSLLLEEEDDIVPVSLNFGLKENPAADLDVSNGNKVPSASCSDSESPTEPLTQRLAAILRSKCGVSAGGTDEPY
ncbi:serine-aspartate repeat-containing protein F [Drosophila ficusphila]|uniref:serine-aspartate repeat-containing protein F n=1 Tax=Drosophila ficusphila TaxID=30025 RepID=UPI0007E71808|nr:serine-aspartate repeat-containing protein F [Drosophila ficusphila]